MKPSTALEMMRDLVSNSQLLRSITTQKCVWETLTINLGRFFFFFSSPPSHCVLRMYQLFHGEIAHRKPPLNKPEEKPGDRWEDKQCVKERKCFLSRWEKSEHPSPGWIGKKWTRHYRSQSFSKVATQWYMMRSLEFSQTTLVLILCGGDKPNWNSG